MELTWLEGMEKGGLRFSRGGVGTGESSRAWARLGYPFIIKTPPTSVHIRPRRCQL